MESKPPIRSFAILFASILQCIPQENSFSIRKGELENASCIGFVSFNQYLILMSLSEFCFTCFHAFYPLRVFFRILVMMMFKFNIRIYESGQTSSWWHWTDLIYLIFFSSCVIVFRVFKSSGLHTLPANSFTALKELQEM